MDERQEKSILEMGRGAIMERADYEMRAMIWLPRFPVSWP